MSNNTKDDLKSKSHSLTLWQSYVRLDVTVNGNVSNQQSEGIEKEILLSDISDKNNVASTYSEDLEVNSRFFKESENQELLLSSQSVVADPSLDNIEISSKLSTTSEAVVFSSTETVIKFKNKPKLQSDDEKNNSSSQIYNSFEDKTQEYVVHAEPKVQVEVIMEETLKSEVNESKSVGKINQEDLKKTASQHEDIPSFSEWAQKQLEEAEKKKTDQNETTDRFSKTRGKFRNKNYASPDCGAKIVAANPESLSSSSVLSSLKDEYMLNYCKNRIWFVVELCEAIQAKQLDLANFELFSSSPKHFSVFNSHRFPTREWNSIGKFTAQDSRDIQTFNLHPHLFGKFVKIELHSHYGKEQFCPISWVGVYGTSEFEVLAKEDGRHMSPEDDEGDSYEEDLFEGQSQDSPKNLFSSATDAVLSIVKKATAPFMKSDNNVSETESAENTSKEKYSLCISPRHITVCNNCTQNFYDEVFNILSCKHLILADLIFNSFVRRILIGTESCTKYGLDFGSLRTGAPFPSNYLQNPGQEVNYLTVMLKNSFVAALCNVLAVFENKVVVNGTAGTNQALKNITGKSEVCDEGNISKPGSLLGEASFSTGESSSKEWSATQQLQFTKSPTFAEIFKQNEHVSEIIEPTKTLTEDEVKKLLPSDMYSNTVSEIEVEKATESLNHVQVTSTATPLVKETETVADQSLKEIENLYTEMKDKNINEAENKSVNTASQYSTLDSIISDINAIEKDENSASNSNVPSANNIPAESIFLRLANRIKSLEINMSLSSTYLEELSKRYRTQLDLLSKTLNLTIWKIEDFSRLEKEREQKKEKEILFLRMQLANLTKDLSTLLREKNSWRPRASSISQHLFFILLEVLFIWAVFGHCNRSANKKVVQDKSDTIKKSAKKCRRRNSLEGVKGHETPQKKARRPSDEALEIAVSRNLNRDCFKTDKKRRRKKKDSKCSVNVIQLSRKKSDVVMPSNKTEKPCGNSKTEESPGIAEVPNLASSSSEIEISNRFALISSHPLTPPENMSSVAKALKGLSRSSIFMKTALASRNSRMKLVPNKASSQEYYEEMSKEKRNPTSLRKYVKKFF